MNALGTISSFVMAPDHFQTGPFLKPLTISACAAAKPRKSSPSHRQAVGTAPLFRLVWSLGSPNLGRVPKPGNVTFWSKCHLSVLGPPTGAAGGALPTYLCERKGLPRERGRVSNTRSFRLLSAVVAALTQIPAAGRDRVFCPSLPWGSPSTVSDLSASICLSPATHPPAFHTQAQPF
ncbi:hypothetical protein SKAU_G00300710 [Synaphobranchus kaupii]|uniref:Uncharacterized protein n=1 Tax=Synaphobranchus kaupii TaxID=118154 RepID=A0A9Q1EVN8_SYNKA|nr:hypothetical protein SKAU_G00300710 [Synaphobranchus kaupii]